ncbi:MAG: 1-deoxy-D-xylulose-5-phosphate synthase [Muribaculaceae bacterium]|nr:1-deoxy-D-xylulose-5-phosphate synthase [Muribaculaceae bacterium]
MATNNQPASTPLLQTIDSPDDLRRLSPEQLPQVCAELRQFLINSLSTNPGHFASSMGAVELTVALHYVFNTPYDRIVWDVGHQAYGHKVLTGRRDNFNQNRKLGGLSGFPNPDESIYDTFAAGHASNSISAALGMAVASKLNNDSPRRNVVAVIGDASISGGLAFEGINNAANTPNNLLIVLNDNDMSIDRNVGSLNSYLAHITTSKTYNNLRYKAYKALRKLKLISDNGKGSIMRFNNSLKSLLSHQQNIFEGLNIRYFGPFDGHDLPTIIRVLNDIRDMEGPRILHLRTVKGKGYEPAEKDPAVWHAPGRFDALTGNRLEKAPADNQPLKYQDVFGNTLLELAKKNDNIVAITAAMLSGTSTATMQRELPGRVFDVGISEGHAVTFAGGLAKEGKQPFVAIYSSFLQRAYDHIIHDVALHRQRVTFCIDRAGLVGEDGPTHHGAFDLAYLRTVPNMTVAAPRNEHMLRHLLFTAQAENCGPLAIRYPRGKGRIADWKCEMHTLPIGKGEKLRDGEDLAILSIGTVADQVTEAIARAEAEGLSVAHYDMIFLKPLDEEILREIAGKYHNIITVEDGTVNGGLGSAVAEWLEDNGVKDVSLTRLGIPDKFIPQGTPAQLAELCGIDSESIYRVIRSAVKPNSQQR